MRLTTEDLREIAKFFIEKLKPEDDPSKIHFFGPCIRKIITESNWDPNYDVIYISFGPIYFDFANFGLKNNAYNKYTGATLGTKIKINKKYIMVKKEAFHDISRNGKKDYILLPDAEGLDKRNHIIGNDLAIPLSFFLEEENRSIAKENLKKLLEKERISASIYDMSDDAYRESAINLLIDGYFVNKFKHPETAHKEFYLSVNRINNREILRHMTISALDSRHFVNACNVFLQIPMTDCDNLEDYQYRNWKKFTDYLKELDELYPDRDRVIIRTLLYLVHGKEEYSVDEFLGWSLGLKKEYRTILKNLRFALFNIYGEWEKYRFGKNDFNIVARRVFRVLYRKDLFDYYEEYIEPILHVYYSISLDALKAVRSIVNTLTIEDVKLPVNGGDINEYIKKHPNEISEDKNWVIGVISNCLLDLFDKNPELTKKELIDQIKYIKLA